MRPRNSDTERRRLYALLTSHYDDRLIASWQDITQFVHRIGLRRLNGRTITYRTIGRWAERHGFPLLPGQGSRHVRYAAVTSVLAVQAWVLSRPMNGTRELFTIWTGNTRPSQPERTVPEAA